MLSLTKFYSFTRRKQICNKFLKDKASLKKLHITYCVYDIIQRVEFMILCKNVCNVD